MPRPGPAFSNGTEHDMWAVNWCYVCMVDAPFRNTGKGSGCPLILTAYLGDIPDEWIEQEPWQEHYPSDAFHCINFKPPGWRNPEPRPKPEPPQNGLFQRPERGTRMLLPLTQAEPAPRPVETVGAL